MSACRWIYAGSFNEEETKATILVEFSLTNQDMPHFLKSHEMSSQDFKMVRHTQKIRKQVPNELFECV